MGAQERGDDGVPHQRQRRLPLFLCNQKSCTWTSLPTQLFRLARLSLDVASLASAQALGCWVEHHSALLRHLRGFVRRILSFHHQYRRAHSPGG